MSLNTSTDGDIYGQDSAACIQKKGALFISEEEQINLGTPFTMIYMFHRVWKHT